MKAKTESSVWSRPGTKVGMWAVSLGIVYVVLSIINSAIFMQLSGKTWWGQPLLPFYGIFMLACGLVAGILGSIAVIKKRERSWLVWLSILPGVLVVFLLMGEFLFPH